MEIEEKQLIKYCKQGNSEAFGFLYEMYIEKIYDFIYFKTHHRETAEDLTAQVFTKALENIKKFNNKGYFKAWLYKIARNQVIDYYRTNHSYSNLDDVWGLSDEKDLLVDMDVKYRIEKVKEYLKELSIEQRDIIIMRIWQDMSYQEIAEVMDKTVPSCKMSFSRAMFKLRKEMPLGLLIIFLLNKF